MHTWLCQRPQRRNATFAPEHKGKIYPISLDIRHLLKSGEYLPHWGYLERKISGNVQRVIKDINYQRGRHKTINYIIYIYIYIYIYTHTYISVLKYRVNITTYFLLRHFTLHVIFMF
jgi:hypothetical protein